MEQRIISLEEELKLLKNQVRSVLLDIKENLSAGDWQLEPGLRRKVDPYEETEPPSEDEYGSPFASNSKPRTGMESILAERNPVDEKPDTSLPNPNGKENRIPPPAAAGNSSCVHNSDYEHDANQDSPVAKELRRDQSLEPLTMVMLLKWLERCQAILGKESTVTLLDIYCAGKNLSGSTYQVIGVLRDMLKNNSAGITASAVPLLLELDEIFRPHQEHSSFQKMVLKILLQSQVATAVNRL